MHVQAFAKINLSLEVVGRRPDGFHDLVSVMQTVSLADSLSLHPAARLSLRCSDTSLEAPDNLALRAAIAAHQAWHLPSSVEIRLEKRIPVAAGLGGGSSDAGAVLLGLRALFEANAGCEEMVELGAELGSDVPFFLWGGTALVEGRGERVRALPSGARPWYVLANPGVAVSTREVFSSLTPQNWSSGQTTLDLAAGIEAGKTPCLGVNSLQDALFQLCEPARTCFRDVAEVTGGQALVSGSGASVFGICRNEKHAREAAEILSARGYWSTAAHAVDAPDVPTPCRPLTPHPPGTF